MGEPRLPGCVPDEEGFGPARLDGPGGDDIGGDVTGGFDTDGDGLADTVVTGDGVDLVLLTDLDGDGLADQVLRIGPDGVVREAVLSGTAFPDAAFPDAAFPDEALPGAPEAVVTNAGTGGGPHLYVWLADPAPW